MRGKFGLMTEEETDPDLIGEFLSLLERRGGDFTPSFRALSELAGNVSGTEEALLNQSLGDDPAWIPWKTRWMERLDRQPQSRADTVSQLKAHNPAVIPRNHLVERAIQETLSGEESPFMDKMVEALSKPYEDQLEGSCLDNPPTPRREGHGNVLCHLRWKGTIFCLPPSRRDKPD